MGIKKGVFKNGNLEKRHIQERDIAGDLVVVFLHGGASFHLKVTATEPGYISGYDDERMDIKVSAEDIDYVIGGKRVG